MECKSSSQSTVLLPLLSLLVIISSLHLGILQAMEMQSASDFQLTIVSHPQGPPYPTASWIRFACRAENLSDGFAYQWVGKCNETGNVQFVLDTPSMDEEYFAEFWLLSTPLECVDVAECNLIDLDTFEVVATANVYIGKTTGIGLSIDNHFNPGIIFDNTSFILPLSDCQSMETPTIQCHSSSKSATDRSYWLDPHGNIIPSNTSSSAEASTAIGLTLCEQNGSNEDLLEGVYTCVAIDENEDTVSTFLGVYFDMTQVDDISTNMGFQINGDSLSLFFTSEGLPVTTVQWLKDSTPLQAGGSDFTTNQMITNTSQASYTSELVINDFIPYAAGPGSNFACNVYMDWFAVDLYSTVDEDQQHASGQFILATLGETTTIDCAFTKVTSSVQWVEPLPEGSQIVPSSVGNSISMSVHIRADHHGQKLMCRGVNSNRETVYISFMIIVHVPLTVEVIPVGTSEPMAVSAGDSHTLRCCASIGNTTEDLFSELSLEWVHYIDNGPMVTIATRNGANMRHERRRPCIKLTFDPLTEADAGIYECRSRLSTSSQEITRSILYELQVLPSNVTVFTGSPPPTTTTNLRDTTVTTPTKHKPETQPDVDDSSSQNDVFILSITIATSFAFVVVVVVVMLMIALTLHLRLLKKHRTKMVDSMNKKEAEKGSPHETCDIGKAEKPTVVSATTVVMMNGETTKSV